MLHRETTLTAMLMQRNVLDFLWRFFSSRRLTLLLLTVISVVVLFSAVFPQMPSGMAIGSSEYALWYAEIRARYLQWADPLADLSLFNISGSLWLKLPLAFLVVNLAVCAVEQFEAVSRWSNPSTKEFDEAFRRASDTGTFVLSGTVERAVGGLRTLLEGHRYKVEVQEEEGDSYLIAQRFSLAKWGTLLGHGGLIVAIVGVLLGGRLAWREEEIPLSPGQEYQIQHVPSLSIRLDDFQADLYTDGTPRSYWAQLTLLEGAKEMTTGIVEPNVPFTYRGISVYQRSHGSLVTIRGLDAQGESISLQALAPGGTLQDEATLQLSESENEAYVAAPGQNLILRLVFEPHLPTDAGEKPALLVQAYRGGVTDLVFSETLFGSGSLLIGGNSYSLEWEHYALLSTVRDPSFAPTMLGAASLLAAAIMMLYLPPRYIWTAISGEGKVVEIRLVRLGEGDKGGAAREFEVLLDEIEDSL